eukprot:jgi/Botrbrau1/14419/Bobra.0014s0066.1
MYKGASRTAGATLTNMPANLAMSLLVPPAVLTLPISSKMKSALSWGTWNACSSKSTIKPRYCPFLAGCDTHFPLDKQKPRYVNSNSSALMPIHPCMRLAVRNIASSTNVVILRPLSLRGAYTCSMNLV